MVLTRTVATQCDLCLDDLSAPHPTMREDSPSYPADPTSGDPTNGEPFCTVAEILVLLGEADRVTSHGIRCLTERKRLTEDLVGIVSSTRCGRLNSSSFDDNPFGPQVLHRALLRRGDGTSSTASSGFDDAADGEVERCYRDAPACAPSDAADSTAVSSNTEAKWVPPLHPPATAAAAAPVGLQAVKSVASNCSLGSWAYVFTPRTPTHPPSGARPDYVNSNASDSPVSLPSPARDGAAGVVRRPPRAPQRFNSAAEPHEASLMSRQSTGTPPMSPYNRPLSGGAGNGSSHVGSAASSSSASRSSRNHSPREDFPQFPCALFVDPPVTQAVTLPPRRLSFAVTVAHFSRAFHTAETNLSDLWHVVVAALTDRDKRKVLLRRARHLIADVVSTISNANEPVVALVVQFRATSFVQWCSSRLTTSAVHLSW